MHSFNEVFCLDFYDFGCRNAILITGACFQTPKKFPWATAPGTPFPPKIPKNFRVPGILVQVYEETFFRTNRRAWLQNSY